MSMVFVEVHGLESMAHSFISHRYRARLYEEFIQTVASEYYNLRPI